MSNILICRRCKQGVDPTVHWREFASGEYHLEAKCPECKRHLKFLTQTAEWLELAPPKPVLLHEVEMVCGVCKSPVVIIDGEAHHA